MNMNTVQCKDTVVVLYIVVLFDFLFLVCRLVASLIPSVFQHVVVDYGLTLSVCFAHLTPGSTPQPSSHTPKPIYTNTKT